MAILLANQDATSFATVSVNLNCVKGKAWIMKGSKDFQNKGRIDGGDITCKPRCNQFRHRFCELKIR